MKAKISVIALAFVITFVCGFILLAKDDSARHSADLMSSLHQNGQLYQLDFHKDISVEISSVLDKTGTGRSVDVMLLIKPSGKTLSDDEMYQYAVRSQNATLYSPFDLVLARSTRSIGPEKKSKRLTITNHDLQKLYNDTLLKNHGEAPENLEVSLYVLDQNPNWLKRFFSKPSDLKVNSQPLAFLDSSGRFNSQLLRCIDPGSTCYEFGVAVWSPLAGQFIHEVQVEGELQLNEQFVAAAP